MPGPFARTPLKLDASPFAADLGNLHYLFRTGKLNRDFGTGRNCGVRQRIFWKPPGHSAVSALANA